MTDLSNKPISYTGSHPLELAYRALLARAEAAEAEAAERLEDALFAEQRATDAELERDGAILAASDAERHAENAMHGLAHFRARVAELEAQLAAQGWRPVTEEPSQSDLYQVADFLEDGTPYAVGYTFWEDGGWVDQCDHELLPGMTHYRPIPPLPVTKEPTQ